MNQKEIKYVWFPLVLTIFIYYLFYLKTGYIFGKSDVDNYLNNERLISFPQHIYFYYLSYLPIWSFVFIIPSIFYVGIIYPIFKKYDNKDIFSIIFGTSIVFQYFIVALWSQFLCFALFLWAMKLKNPYKTLLYLLSFAYYPMLLFFLWIHQPVLFYILIIILLSFYPEFFFWGYDVFWPPLFSILFLINPYLLYLVFKEKNWKNNIYIFIGSLSKLGRFLIYIYPMMNFRLNSIEKICLIIWWLILLFLFINAWKYEMLNCTWELCRNIYVY